MHMSNDDIKLDYRQAKDKTKIIGILADLNSCDKSIIKAIITDDESAVDEMIDKMLKSGANLMQIKAKSGKSMEYLMQKQEIFNKTHDKQKEKSCFEKRARELYEMKLSDSKIGKELGMSTVRIRQWRKSRNLPTFYRRQA